MSVVPKRGLARMWPLIGFASAAMMLTGCAGGAGQRKNEDSPRPPGHTSASKALPPVADIVSRFNARATNFPRLWASHFSGVDFQEVEPDGTTKKRSETFEGHLQYIQPRSVLMTFDKVGNTYAILGSDDRQYWWLELGDAPRATVGTHAAATPERARQLGMPLAPEDLTRLLGLRPLGVDAEKASTLAWSPDGRWLVLSRADADRRESIWLDPVTAEPSRIEVTVLTAGSLGGLREERFSADLSKYEQVEVGDVALPHPELGAPRMPSRVRLSLWDDQTRVRLEFYTKEIKQARPRAGIFDFARLARTYRVKPEAVRNLDTEPDAPASPRQASQPAPKPTRPLDLDSMWR